ncbi:hypothetical protein BKA70DRAFT_1325921 [Coprinopsis sp. MPI-PUGE-AT-0042]|nr:hypothetical protein BKA70DRAFT_1325921 [Coprinopsis sp. MPI-PUGE-AT-0042]
MLPKDWAVSRNKAPGFKIGILITIVTSSAKDLRAIPRLRRSLSQPKRVPLLKASNGHSRSVLGSTLKTRAHLDPLPTTSSSTARLTPGTNPQQAFASTLGCQGTTTTTTRAEQHLCHGRGRVPAPKTTRTTSPTPAIDSTCWDCGVQLAL